MVDSQVAGGNQVVGVDNQGTLQGVGLQGSTPEVGACCSPLEGGTHMVGTPEGEGHTQGIGQEGEHRHNMAAEEGVPGAGEEVLGAGEEGWSLVAEDEDC